MTLEYIAGLITGEGCFCLAVMRVASRRGKVRIVPTFGMFMTDEETIREVAETLKEHGLPVYYQERRKAARGKLHVGVHASGIKRVKRYCDTFVPLLTGEKKRAALLVQEFCDSRLATPRGGTRGNPPYTERQIQLVEEVRAVNSSGNGRKNAIETLRDHTSDARPYRVKRWSEPRGDTGRLAETTSPAA